MANLRIKDQYTNLELDAFGAIQVTTDNPTNNLKVGDSISSIGVKDGLLCVDESLIGVRQGGIRDKFVVPITNNGIVTNYQSFLNAIKPFNNNSFSPNQLTTIGWWDASDTSSTNIIESGGLVSQLTDKGSTGIEHLVQGTGSKQMSTGLQTINGINALSSTTADRFMQNLTFPVPASGNLAITFVCQIDGQVASINASNISMDAISGEDWQLQSNNSSQFNGEMNAPGIGDRKSLVGGHFTGPDIWSIIFDWDSSLYSVYINGVFNISASYTTKLDVSQVLRIFNNRGANSAVFGLFGEMIITEDVSDTQKAINEGYLSNKWGIAL